MATEDDPLRSGAIFRMQQHEYAAVKSPVPRMLPRARSVGPPISVDTSAVGSNALCHRKSLSLPTKPDASWSSSDAVVDEDRGSMTSSACEDIRFKFVELCNASRLPRVLLSSSVQACDRAAGSRGEHGDSPDDQSQSIAASCSDGNGNRARLDCKCNGSEAGGSCSGCCPAKVDTPTRPEHELSACQGAESSTMCPTRSPPYVRSTTWSDVNDSPGNPPDCPQLQRSPSPRDPASQEGSKIGLTDRSTRQRSDIGNRQKFDTAEPSTTITGQRKRREKTSSRVACTKSNTRSGKADEGVVNTTRSGRTSVPVLDWWRSQRLSRMPDGKVIVAPGSSRDEFSPQNAMAPPRNMAVPKSSSTDSTKRKTGVPKADGVTTSDDCKAPLWTTAQINRLDIAHKGTAPTTKDFWNVVASNVDGKDPSECQQQWFEQFATPKARRKPARTKRTNTRQVGTPVGTKTSQSKILGTPNDDSIATTSQLVTHADADDLFHATPMRGRGRVRGLAESSSGPSTPKTPAGPGASYEERGAAVERREANGHDCSKRAVSKAYVQAMSKKMRKASANPRKLCGRVGVRGQPRQHAARKPHRVQATTFARGRVMEASVASSGAVNVTVAESGDDDSECSSSAESESDE
ncbi:unnamed protein product [Sphacelaria rigidula]